MTNDLIFGLCCGIPIGAMLLVGAMFIMPHKPQYWHCTMSDTQHPINVPDRCVQMERD